MDEDAVQAREQYWKVFCTFCLTFWPITWACTVKDWSILLTWHLNVVEGVGKLRFGFCVGSFRSYSIPPEGARKLLLTRGQTCWAITHLQIISFISQRLRGQADVSKLLDSSHSWSVAQWQRRGCQTHRAIWPLLEVKANEVFCQRTPKLDKCPSEVDTCQQTLTAVTTIVPMAIPRQIESLFWPAMWSSFGSWGLAATGSLKVLHTRWTLSYSRFAQCERSWKPWWARQSIFWFQEGRSFFKDSIGSNNLYLIVVRQENVQWERGWRD